MGEKSIKLRKLDHIVISLQKKVEEGDPLFSEVELVHQPLPELNIGEISLETEFLGKRLAAPIIITGMTGGHPLGGELNALLAEVAEERRLAIGVGSQRAALVERELERTYRVVRETAPSVPVIGNIGAQQLLADNYVEMVERAAEMLEADAVAIHLNPSQESFQPEGDPHYRGVVERLSKLIERVRVPLIVKETGCGISKETAALLKQVGVKIIDVAGRGGTSWIKAEMYRSLRSGDYLKAGAARTFLEWGIPTAISVLEVKSAYPEATVICSGGVRSGLDVAKCIALGADYAGMALPFLRAAVKGKAHLEMLVDRVEFELRAAMFLTGSRNLRELQSKRPVLGPRIVNWINQRDLRLPWV